MFWMPRWLRISSRSVAQKEPLPGLSMIGSPCERVELRNDVPAGLAAHQDAAARAGVADAGADPARAPALVRRQVGEIGPMALARMDDVVALGAHRRQHRPIGSIGALHQRQVVAHRVDVAALAAEIGLHVDDDQRRVVRPAGRRCRARDRDRRRWYVLV